LYAYRTAFHSSTGVSPFELMYGCCAHKLPLSTRTAHDVISYQDHFLAKLPELYDFVQLNDVKASSQQKHYFDHGTQIFMYVGQEVITSKRKQYNDVGKESIHLVNK